MPVVGELDLGRLAYVVLDLARGLLGQQEIDCSVLLLEDLLLAVPVLVLRHDRSGIVLGDKCGCSFLVENLVTEGLHRDLASLIGLDIRASIVELRPAHGASLIAPSFRTVVARAACLTDFAAAFLAEISFRCTMYRLMLISSF